MHILATQFLRKTTNSPNLVVHKSWYRSIQCITGKASGRWSTGMLLVDTSSRHWLRLCFKQLCITFLRFATLYSYLALYYYYICAICHPILLFGTILLLVGTQEYKSLVSMHGSQWLWRGGVSQPTPWAYHHGSILTVCYISPRRHACTDAPLI